jgi:hypothetical protein
MLDAVAHLVITCVKAVVRMYSLDASSLALTNKTISNIAKSYKWDEISERVFEWDTLATCNGYIYSFPRQVPKANGMATLEGWIIHGKRFVIDCCDISCLTWSEDYGLEHFESKLTDAERSADLHSHQGMISDEHTTPSCAWQDSLPEKDG